MDRKDYIRKINSYESMLDYNMNQIRQKEQELEDVEEFQMQHQRAVDDMEGQFYLRKQRIERTPLDSSRIRIFSGYKDSMLDLLEGVENQQLFWQKEEEQAGILQVIRNLEEEIRRLRNQQYGYENILSDLHYQLRIVEE